MKRLIYLFNLLLISGIASRAQNSPDWARHAVWYQIFPERFANGDPSNDPTLASLHGAYPHNDSSAWTIHPWGSDWYELQPYEKQNGQNIWYNIQRRRYGGDLQGIINKLDYISELGITAIYLNPIFYAPSLHKYDAICYHHVDPYFGPDPEGDIELMKSEVPDDPKSWHWTAADKLALQLIKEVHARGMKIIFDGVWNHMGIENVFLKDVAEKGKLSKYANWFIIEDWDKPGTMNMPFTYKGWFGVKELPEIREDADGIVSGPKEYIYSCTARWMSPDGDVTAGIDGWRLDVAYCVNRKFWKEWNRYVHHLNKYSYTTAEIVDGPVEVKKYLDAGFDAVMNYNFGFAAHDYFINHNLGSTGTQLYSKWTEMFLNYQQQMYVMQNLFDSHDAQRLSSAIANPDLGHFAEWGKFFGATQAEHNAGYNVSCPGSENMWQRMRLMIAYQSWHAGGSHDILWR